jgi:ApbE superfamily uncharacterized protein (UPF0280 family)
MSSIRDLTKDVLQKRVANGNKMLDTIKESLHDEVQLQQKVMSELTVFVKDEISMVEKLMKAKFEEVRSQQPPATDVTVEVVDSEEF